MRAAPVSSAQIMSGIILSNIVRLAATGAIFYIVMLCFGAVHLGWSLLALPIAILGAMSFALPIMVISTGVENDRGQHNIIIRLVVTPMMLLSGTMYPLATLPIWLQWVGWISPWWHSAQLARAVSYGTTEPAWLVVVHLLFLTIPVVVCWFWVIARGTRRLEK